MQTIVAIQLLRAIAALAVVGFHMSVSLNYWGGTNLVWPVAGSAGVDLFFVISGFIMTVISWETFGERGAPSEFMARRLIRIVPLYWLLTTIYLLSNSYPPLRILGSYFFFWGGELPIVKVGWTLDFEMLFYIVFAVGLLLPRWLGLAAIGAALLGIAHAGIPFFSDLHVYQFGFGAVIGIGYMTGVKLPNAVRLVLIVGGFVGLGYFGTLPDWLTRGALAATIVAGAVLGAPIRTEGKLVAAGVLLGDASYALYLIHPPLVHMTATAMRSSGVVLANAQLLYSAVALVVTIIAAVIVHLYVERPMLAGLRRFAPRPATA